MSDTFKDMIDFITNDPLMMILCIAIVVLIIIFLIVLIFGKKDKDAKVENSVKENTTQLFTSEIDNAVLKSTQEYNFQNANVVNDVPIIGQTSSNNEEKEAPINIDEALSLKESREIDIELPKTTMEVPVITKEETVKLEVPEKIITENTSETLTKEELPISKTENFTTQTFSSVSIAGKEMPKAEENPNNTEIIRHVKTEEEKKESIEKTINDDIDLPKLNTNKENSVLSSLSGESFEIK